MKKILIIGIALVAVASLFFLQCEKTELADAGEISFKRLNAKVWYLDRMTIKGEDVVFDEQTAVEFDRTKMSLKANDKLTCTAEISYPSTNQFTVDTEFDCLQQPTLRVKPEVKRLMQVLMGNYELKISEHEVVISAAGFSLILKDSWTPASSPFNFDNTVWEVNELQTSAKDISLVWETEKPKLRFERNSLFMELPKNNCNKAYAVEKGKLVFDDVFNCKSNPCCGSDKNTKLAETLKGEMTFESQNKEVMVLRNSEGTLVYLKQLPAQPNNVAPGEVN